MSRSNYGVSGGGAEPFAPSRLLEARTAVERRVGQFVTAWNRHDPVQMASIWHDDGDLINPFGRFARGHSQVQELFRDEHAGPMKTCANQMSINAMRLASDDVAIVDADCTLTGMRGADGKELPTFKPHVLLVLTRREGDWRVLSARAYAMTPAPGAAS